MVLKYYFMIKYVILKFMFIQKIQFIEVECRFVKYVFEFLVLCFINSILFIKYFKGMDYEDYF